MERCVPLTKAFFLFQCFQKGICKAYGEYNKIETKVKNRNEEFCAVG